MPALETDAMPRTVTPVTDAGVVDLKDPAAARPLTSDGRGLAAYMQRRVPDNGIQASPRQQSDGRVPGEPVRR